MLHICADCTAAYPPDLLRCPQCTGTRWRPQGEEGGPIHVTGQIVEDGEHVEDGEMELADGQKSTVLRTVGEQGAEEVHVPDGATVVPPPRARGPRAR